MVAAARITEPGARGEPQGQQGPTSGGGATKNAHPMDPAEEEEGRGAKRAHRDAVAFTMGVVGGGAGAGGAGAGRREHPQQSRAAAPSPRRGPAEAGGPTGDNAELKAAAARALGAPRGSGRATAPGARSPLTPCSSLAEPEEPAALARAVAEADAAAESAAGHEAKAAPAAGADSDATPSAGTPANTPLRTGGSFTPDTATSASALAAARDARARAASGGVSGDQLATAMRGLEARQRRDDAAGAGPAASPDPAPRQPGAQPPQHSRAAPPPPPPHTPAAAPPAAAAAAVPAPPTLGRTSNTPGSSRRGAASDIPAIPEDAALAPGAAEAPQPPDADGDGPGLPALSVRPHHSGGLPPALEDALFGVPLDEMALRSRGGTPRAGSMSLSRASSNASSQERPDLTDLSAFAALAGASGPLFGGSVSVSGSSAGGAGSALKAAAAPHRLASSSSSARGRSRSPSPSPYADSGADAQRAAAEVAGRAAARRRDAVEEEGSDGEGEGEGDGDSDAGSSAAARPNGGGAERKAAPAADGGSGGAAPHPRQSRDSAGDRGDQASLEPAASCGLGATFSVPPPQPLEPAASAALCVPHRCVTEVANGGGRPECWDAEAAGGESPARGAAAAAGSVKSGRQGPPARPALGAQPGAQRRRRPFWLFGCFARPETADGCELPVN
ncbi:hypothetical protein Rsub_12171 [Raphidocelis subcapitata]|uniref:Uncharacterized protein n=1 Tax=Raphidocelis subcapitata TaxID=307507 RepID=A0A2V0PPH3_9CHLO|nr:hypothetical protein Rsub_12171 [Raphidocelis subcapitata]|eukprot:GBF99367.1 hypothetical protein Rsub_12171 [Raphidocelis subcapitata]